MTQSFGHRTHCAFLNLQTNCCFYRMRSSAAMYLKYNLYLGQSHTRSLKLHFSKILDNSDFSKIKKA